MLKRYIKMNIIHRQIDLNVELCMEVCDCWSTLWIKKSPIITLSTSCFGGRIHLWQLLYDIWYFLFGHQVYNYLNRWMLSFIFIKLDIPQTSECVEAFALSSNISGDWKIGVPWAYVVAEKVLKSLDHTFTVSKVSVRIMFSVLMSPCNITCLMLRR